MKNLLLILLIGMISMINNESMETAEPSIQVELHQSEYTAGIFGWGKPKYKIKKIQRKNSPKRKNKRNKKLLKKWGLAEVEITGKEVNREA